ncbi:MAG: hypothetical protein ACI8TQ_003131 [Planctomycetota bacterium]|jgi:hypothetical protein
MSRKSGARDEVPPSSKPNSDSLIRMRTRLPLAGLAIAVALVILFLWNDDPKGSGVEIATAGPSSTEPDTELESPPTEALLPVTNERAAVESTPKSATKPTPVVNAKPEAGVIHGIVRDDDDLPVSGIWVQLFMDREHRDQTLTLDDGSFRFEELEAERYSVRIDSDKLPDHLLGPWRQDYPAYAGGYSYDSKRVDIPDEGGVFEIGLRVFAKSVAFGRVVAADGSPVENVHVRLQSSAASGQPSSLCSDAQTDEDGRFEMTDVYPGLFILNVWPQRATIERYQTQLAPIPQGIEILAGGRYDLGIIRLGGGRNSVVGRVIDQGSVPFNGLPVQAFPAGNAGEGHMDFGLSGALGSAQTDENGYYRLEKLPDAAIKIHIGSDYMNKPLGEAQTAFWIPHLLMELSGASEHFAPDAVLPRSRPVRIFGSITMDETWKSKSKASYDRVSIEVQLLDPQLPPIPNRPGFPSHRSYEIDSDSGAFEFFFETPQHPIKVSFRCSRGKTDSFVELIYDLVPNGEIELFPVFPHAAK